MVHLLVIALFVAVLTPGPEYVAPMYERVGPIGASAMVLGALVAIWMPTCFWPSRLPSARAILILPSS